jgi:hypothetical protein
VYQIRRNALIDEEVVARVVLGLDVFHRGDPR